MDVVAFKIEHAAQTCQVAAYGDCRVVTWHQCHDVRILDPRIRDILESNRAADFRTANGLAQPVNVQIRLQICGIRRGQTVAGGRV